MCARKEQTSVISITCHLLCVNSMGTVVPVNQLSTLHFDCFVVEKTVSILIFICLFSVIPLSILITMKIDMTDFGQDFFFFFLDWVICKSEWKKYPVCQTILIKTVGVWAGIWCWDEWCEQKRKRRRKINRSVGLDWLYLEGFVCNIYVLKNKTSNSQTLLGLFS